MKKKILFKKIWTSFSICFVSTILLASCAHQNNSSESKENNSKDEKESNDLKPEIGKTVTDSNDQILNKANLIIKNSNLYPSQVVKENNSLDMKQFKFSLDLLSFNDLSINLFSFSDETGSLQVKIQKKNNSEIFKIVNFNLKKFNYLEESLNEIIIIQNKTLNKDISSFVNSWNQKTTIQERTNLLEDLINWNYGINGNINYNSYKTTFNKIDNASIKDNPEYKKIGTKTFEFNYQLSYDVKYLEENSTEIKTITYPKDNKNKTLKIDFIPEIEGIFNSLSVKNENLSKTNFPSFYAKVFENKGLLSDEENKEIEEAWSHYPKQLLNNANLFADPKNTDYSLASNDWINNWLQLDSKYLSEFKEMYEFLLSKKYVLKFDNIFQPDDLNGALKVQIRLWKDLDNDVDTNNSNESTDIFKIFELNNLRKWDQSNFGKNGFHVRLKTSNEKGELFLKNQKNNDDTDITRWNKAFERLGWNLVFEKYKDQPSNFEISLPFESNTDVKNFDRWKDILLNSKNTNNGNFTIKSNYTFMYDSTILNLYRPNINGYPLNWSNLNLKILGFKFKKVGGLSTLFAEYDISFDIKTIDKVHKVSANNESFGMELSRKAENSWDLDTAFQIALANKKT